MLIETLPNHSILRLVELGAARTQQNSRQRCYKYCDGTLLSPSTFTPRVISGDQLSRLPIVAAAAEVGLLPPTAPPLLIFILTPLAGLSTPKDVSSGGDDVAGKSCAAEPPLEAASPMPVQTPEPDSTP